VAYLSYRQKMRRNSVTIPFGYYLADDQVTLIENKEELESLERIKKLINEKLLSYRDGAIYLSDLTGRYISHEGLRLRILKENKNDNA